MNGLLSGLKLSMKPARSRIRLWRLFDRYVAAIVVAVVLALFFTGVICIDRFCGRLWFMYRQFIACFLFLFPVTLLLAGWTAFAATPYLRRRRLVSKRLLWRWLPFVAVPIVMNLWGIIFRHGRRSSYPQWQQDVLIWLLGLTVILGVICVIRSRHHLRLAVPCSLWVFIASLSSCFVASMSVTGDWL